MKFTSLLANVTNFYKKTSQLTKADFTEGEDEIDFNSEVYLLE